jgi:hypothetical protein
MNMQKITQNIRLKEWRLQAEDCQNSGKTVKAWCEEQGIKQKTYYYRLNKVRDAACQELTVKQSHEIKKSDTPVFAEVNITRGRNGHTAITLRFGSAEVEIHNGAEAAVIENTLRILKELC